MAVVSRSFSVAALWLAVFALSACVYITGLDDVGYVHSSASASGGSANSGGGHAGEGGSAEGGGGADPSGGWICDHPKPACAKLRDIHFVDMTTGWVAGDAGTILKTTDGGESWKRQQSGTTVQLLSIHFIDAQRGWIVGAKDAFTEGVILATADGGETWAPSGDWPTTGFWDVHFVGSTHGWVLAFDGYLIGGATHSLVYTTDGGTTWSEPLALDIEPPLFFSALHFVDTQTGWVIGGDKIGKTKDGGLTWEEQDLDTDDLRDVHFATKEIGWVVGDGGTILVTEDSGVTWTAQSSGTTHDLNAIYTTSAQDAWVVGNDGTILTTSDGGTTWTFQTAGTTRNMGAVHFVDSQTGFAIGAEAPIVKTTNGGVSWNSNMDLEPEFSDLHAVRFADEQIGWVVGSDGLIMKTDDAGGTWLKQSASTTEPLQALHLFNHTTGWAVGANGTIIKTINGGSWLPQEAGVDANIQGLYFLDALVGWAVGADTTMLATTNGGEDWTTVTSIKNVAPAGSTFSAVHFGDAMTGWVSISAQGNQNNCLLRTVDGAATWEIVTLPGTWWLNAMSFLNADVGVVAGGDGVVFGTTDGGTSWASQTGSLMQNDDLYDVQLLNIGNGSSWTGWAVGRQGAIRSTLGGMAWGRQTSPTTATLHGVHFVNEMTGWAVGTDGTILKTTTGGLE